MKKTLVLLTLSLVIMTAIHFSFTIALALPPNGLVAWWQGEGNANDAVGANHGTLVGGVTFVPGKVGQAFHLNGVNAYVDLGTAVDVPSWPNYAVTLWFRHDGGGTVAGGPGQKIIDKTVFFHDFWIVVHTNPDPPPGPGLGSLLFFTYEGGPSDIIGDFSHDYRDNTWHNVVINKSGSAGEMWIDGTLVDTSDNVRTVSSDGRLVLGYSLSPDSIQRQYFSGLIDDVGIYNRPLTAAEIHTIASVPDPDIAGCIQLQGTPLVGRNVTLKQGRTKLKFRFKRKLTQTTITDTEGCYKFDEAVSGMEFEIIISGPVVPFD